MAPKRSVKQTTSSTPAEEPPAKKVATVLKKNGVSQSSFKKVVEVFSHGLASSLPEETRAMLLAGLPYSLCVASDERQELQELTVSMIGDVVSKVFTGLQARLDAENEKLASVESTKAQLETAVTEAEAHLISAKTSESQAEESLGTASEATILAHAELATRQDEQRLGDASLHAAKSDKDVLEAALTGVFEKLKVGEWEEPTQAKEYFEALAPLMQKVAMDESLKSATQSTLLKKPSSRGSFDSTVIDELDKCFQAKIVEVAAILSAGKPQSEARAASVAEATASVAVAEEAQRHASEALLSAKSAHKEAIASLKAVKANLADFQPQYAKASELRDEEQAKLQYFVDVNLNAFEELRQRPSAKKLAAEAKAKAAAEAERQAAAEAEAKAAAEAEAEAAAEAAKVDPEPSEEDVKMEEVQSASDNVTIAITEKLIDIDVPKAMICEAGA